MVLCDNEILAALENGALKITPRPSASDIGTTAIDLHLSDEFRRWKRPTGGMKVALDPGGKGFDYVELAKAHTEDVASADDGSVTIEPRSRYYRGNCRATDCLAAGCAG